MSLVLIQCPQSGRYISTGIEADAESFDRASPSAHRTLCLVCHKEHVWRTENAVLADPNNWSDDPEIENCFIKAKENSERAERAKSLEERESYLRMERKWLGIADGLKWMVEVGTRHNQESTR
jgi:hypothetical protein